MLPPRRNSRCGFFRFPVRVTRVACFTKVFTHKVISGKTPRVVNKDIIRRVANDQYAELEGQKNDQRHLYCNKAEAPFVLC